MADKERARRRLLLLRLDPPDSFDMTDMTTWTIEGRPLTAAELGVLRACTSEDFDAVADHSERAAEVNRRVELFHRWIAELVDRGAARFGRPSESYTLDKLVDDLPDDEAQTLLVELIRECEQPGLQPYADEFREMLRSRWANETP